MRSIFDAIFYVLRTDCPWRYLPTNFPPWQTVFYHFRCLRLKKIWADAAYRGQELAEWCLTQGNWNLEVVERQPGTRGFSVLPRRWVVEQTLS
ncbi:hypothetical protein KSB_48690 [Ktedonobacter robiniae]|uniref:Insertion element IS402-like domain-containing protein n=1 Tax=Ktedonobacter robiniae TaxID=2778365 RepID=A0ABQ3UUL1_9CHLR|nr:hypothetical protein KSB_48690 [Ktedonobacter robiniae]